LRKRLQILSNYNCKNYTILNQVFHYFSYYANSVTSWRYPFSQHTVAQSYTANCLDVEAMLSGLEDSITKSV